MMFKTKFFLLVALFTFATSIAAQQTGSVKGKVRDSKGKGLESVSVSVRKDGKDVKTGLTDKKGDFRFSGLAVGTYNLVFEKNGYSGGVLYDIEIREKKTNSLRRSIVLTVDQGTLVIIEASVFSPNGFSIYGAKVVIEEIRNDGTSKEVGSGYTSRDGDVLFRFPQGATRYRVTASAKKISASKIIEVNEAAIYRTAITLDLSEEK